MTGAVASVAVSPESATRAISRTSAPVGVPVAWTGRSLRFGLASAGRLKGKDTVAIAGQDGWSDGGLRCDHRGRGSGSHDVVDVYAARDEAPVLDIGADGHRGE